MHNSNILDGAITIEALQHSSLDQGFAAHRAIKQAQGLMISRNTDNLSRRGKPLKQKLSDKYAVRIIFQLK
jgi:hypothetical protein